MFSVNFKKEWRMHKPLLITFFVICSIILLFTIVYSLVMKNLELSSFVTLILTGIEVFIAGVGLILASVFPIILMYKCLKSDLGKYNVHYTLFTPQSVLSWYLPKLVFIFIIQGLFAIISSTTTFIAMSFTQIENLSTPMWMIYVMDFVSTTFDISTFGLITLAFAIYYSFRNKKQAWFLIVAVFILNSILTSIYPLIVQMNSLTGEAVSDWKQFTAAAVTYGISTFIALVAIYIALQLFDKKVEY